MKGANLRASVRITFEEAVFGCEKELELSLKDECTNCHGTGAKPGTSPETCPKCGGRGQVVMTQQSLFGMVQNVRPCPDCNGTGKVIKEKCPDAIFLFVTPPSAEELWHRLMGRGTETEEVIRERMQRASEEAGEMAWYDYLIVNDELEAAVELVHRTIQEAKNAPIRQAERIAELTEELTKLSRSGRG